MFKCEDNHFVCRDPDYSKFDDVASNEIVSPISCFDLINQSPYCFYVPTDEKMTVGDFDSRLFLKVMKNESGLYHLFQLLDECDDHSSVTMLCAYVGKGTSRSRIAQHIAEKWDKETPLYVTFTPMENRLSKYYEQLFLDQYDFRLNNNENTGVGDLFAVWDRDRFDMGTHSNEISAGSKISNFEDLDRYEQAAGKGRSRND